MMMQMGEDVVVAQHMGWCSGLRARQCGAADVIVQRREDATMWCSSMQWVGGVRMQWPGAADEMMRMSEDLAVVCCSM